MKQSLRYLFLLIIAIARRSVHFSRQRIALTGLAQNAVYFGLYDFDRAIALSLQFERREIRMMAQLKLAQGVLEGSPKKSLFADDEH